ncbi:probable LRR receptor-like serine/threonine-protein kinase isoform X2 [Tanacetum coccineum]
MSDFIPFDIQKEIIKRVPDVESLIRFRSVSKSWKSFINSPQFIAGYDVRLSQPHRLILRSRFKTTVFGFRVSLITCDPTIVKISYINRNDMDNIPWYVEIFTLSSKRWQMIPCSNLRRQSFRLKSSPPVAIGRFIYWAAYDRIVADDGISRNKHMIMSFDFITKVFKLVDIPDGIINQFRGGFSISKLRESLILFGYTRENEMLEDAFCGVWMMVHDSVITSFRRIFTIDTLISSINEILGFRKSGEPKIEARKMDLQFATFEVYEPRS